MLSLAPSDRIFLVAGPTDMRKSFDTLAAIVTNELGRDPTSGEYFVFCNRRRNRVKVLFWNRGGFWLCAKRLEKGTFAWPKIGDSELKLSGEELALLLSGIEVREVRRRRWYEPQEKIPR